MGQACSSGPLSKSIVGKLALIPLGTGGICVSATNLQIKSAWSECRVSNPFADANVPIAMDIVANESCDLARSWPFSRRRCPDGSRKWEMACFLASNYSGSPNCSVKNSWLASYCSAIAPAHPMPVTRIEIPSFLCVVPGAAITILLGSMNYRAPITPKAQFLEVTQLLGSMEKHMSASPREHITKEAASP